VVVSLQSKATHGLPGGPIQKSDFGKNKGVGVLGRNLYEMVLQTAKEISLRLFNPV